MIAWKKTETKNENNETAAQQHQPAGIFGRFGRVEVISWCEQIRF